MKGATCALLAVTFVLAVLFACGVTLAAQAKPAQAGQKAADKAAAESSQDADDQSAEKPAPKPAAKPTATKAPAKKSADKDKDAEEPAPQPLTPLEQRLKDLQAALETATQTNRRRIPADTKALVEHLPDKQKGLLNPETNKPIVVNQEMLGKYEVTIDKPKEFITFYADQPTPNKGRAAIYADGEIKYLNEEDFKKAIAASKPKQLSRDDLQEIRERRMFRDK